MVSRFQNRSIIRRIYELLVILFVAVGLILVVLSFWIRAEKASYIARGVGLSLFPAGIVALIVSRFASSITEILTRETIEITIKDRLEEDMRKIEAKVAEGMSTIHNDMKRLSPLYVSCANLGVENVHLTRGAALTNFALFLEAETRKAERGEEARIWIASSSIKGLLEVSEEHFDGRKMLERIVKSGCELQIMMTDPDVADLRAKQENRAPGEIPNEINMHISYLKRIGVKREFIKFYPGTPTVFAIATTDRMLLNPYPYEAEAFRCFTIIVHKTLDPRADIYHQYLQDHFREPWNRAKEISPQKWGAL